MSGLRYCRETEVKTPYYAKEVGLSLYSPEELAYYIDHYLLLLTEEFLEESLYHFLGEECKKPELEGRLRKLMSLQKDFYQALYLIEQELHYLDEGELVKFKSRLEQLKKASPLELQKKKGDFYAECGQYGKALQNYEIILKEKKAEPSFVGRVWHNKGLACVKLMQMQQAMECLYESWKLLGAESIAHEMFILYCMENDIELPKEVCEAVSGETQYRWKEDFDAYSMDAMYQGKAEAVASAFDKDVIRRRVALRELLKEWKQEYREMAG